MDHVILATDVVETGSGMFSASLNGSATKSGFDNKGRGAKARGYEAIMVEVAKGNYTPYVAPPAPDQNLIALQATDKEMARVTEDLIDTLKSIGVITDNDLPSSVVDKMNNRKSLRAKI